MTPRTYATPLAFKKALEQRLKDASDTGVDFARRRQLLVFDRFLARVADTFGESVVLKGGLVLELRLQRARTTKDIDLRVIGAPADTLERLQTAGRLNLGDFMTFEVRPDKHPTIQNEGIPYEGLRFRAECKLAGKVYGGAFGVDISFADPIQGQVDTVVGADTLAFAGISPPTLRLYSVESHVAEKLHAYTLPRSRPNTRVKDLPDLALLSTTKSLVAAEMRRAIAKTFETRGTYAVPNAVPQPPAAWAEPYAKMARDDGLSWPMLKDVTAAVERFLNPVLAGTEGDWEPARGSWTPRP